MEASEVQLQSHATILQQGRELIEFKYLKSIGQGIDAPALVVYDLRDEAVYSFVQIRRGDAARHVANARRHGVVPIAVLHCSSQEAAERLDPSLSAASELSAGVVRAGFFPVVICSENVTSVRWLPVPKG